MKILPICAFYYISCYFALPFYSTYTQKELGFSMTFLAVISAVSAIVRTVSNMFMGKLGDKYGFITLKGIGAFACAIALFINIFTVPANGKAFYMIYIVIYAMASAASGIATTNLIYEYAPLELRTGALAINGTLYGFASFFATLVATPIVDHIQKSGNTFLGMNVYAQQVVSAIGCGLMLLTLLYIFTVGKSAKNRHE
jgi:MFS family permease